MLLLLLCRNNLQQPMMAYMLGMEANLDMEAML
jgi:hypothetical protein